MKTLRLSIFATAFLFSVLLHAGNETRLIYRLGENTKLTVVITEKSGANEAKIEIFLEDSRMQILLNVIQDGVAIGTTYHPQSEVKILSLENPLGFLEFVFPQPDMEVASTPENGFSTRIRIEDTGDFRRNLVEDGTFLLSYLEMDPNNRLAEMMLALPIKNIISSRIGAHLVIPNIARAAAYPIRRFKLRPVNGHFEITITDLEKDAFITDSNERRKFKRSSFLGLPGKHDLTFIEEMEGTSFFKPSPIPKNNLVRGIDQITLDRDPLNVATDSNKTYEELMAIADQPPAPKSTRNVVPFGTRQQSKINNCPTLFP